MNFRPNTNPDVLTKGVLFILAENIWSETEYWLKLSTPRNLLFRPDIYKTFNEETEKTKKYWWQD